MFSLQRNDAEAAHLQDNQPTVDPKRPIGEIVRHRAVYRGKLNTIDVERCNAVLHIDLVGMPQCFGIVVVGVESVRVAERLNVNLQLSIASIRARPRSLQIADACLIAVFPRLLSGKDAIESTILQYQAYHPDTSLNCVIRHFGYVGRGNGNSIHVA